MTKSQEDQIDTSLSKLKGWYGDILFLITLLKLKGQDDHLFATNVFCHLIETEGLRWLGFCYQLIEAEGWRVEMTEKLDKDNFVK